MQFKSFVFLFVVATLVGSSPIAGAIQSGKSPAGIEYVSGGVCHSELLALHADRDKYSFWLTTAAMHSGAHLAGVKVRVFESRTKKTVLQQTMDGPWLFANLPVGRYEVEATFRAAGAVEDQHRKGITTIHKGDHHQMMFHFDSPATRSAEYESPFKDCPYDGKK